MADEEQGKSGAEDQNEEQGEDLENKDDTQGGDKQGSDDQGSDDDKGLDDDNGDDDSGDDTELTKAQKVAKDQKRRAEKAEADAKALRDKYEPKEKTRAPKQSEEVAALTERTARAEDRAIRAELAAAGHKHPDDQKFILDAAKRLGVEPLETAGDELVAGKLKRMGEARATKDATPAPSGRGGGGNSGTNVGKLADKVAAGGALPTDPALAEKVQSELARRSQAAS